MNRKPWTFKFVSIFTGRVIVKEVVGFDKYQEAEDCARGNIPEIAQPVVLLSYN